MRACEIVLGGRLKVKASAKSVNVTGGVAALTLRCVAVSKGQSTTVGMVLASRLPPTLANVSPGVVGLLTGALAGTAPTD